MIIDYALRKLKTRLKRRKNEVEERDSYWEDVTNPEIDLEERIRNPTILAFSAYFHDSSACIIKGGKIVAAADEERFTRKKHDNGFPTNAIKYCLQEAEADSVDAVVFFENPNEKLQRIEETLEQRMPSLRTYRKIRDSWSRVKSKERIEEKFQSETGLENRVLFLDHHLSHAASSYLTSNFGEAAILTVDGVGEKKTTTLGYAKGSNIKLRKRIDFPHSIGLMYTALTTFLGFRANNDEYKVMGLAPYGNMDRESNDFYRKMLEVIDIKSDGSYRLSMQYFGHNQFDSKAYSPELSKLLGVNPRELDSQVTQEHKDIAAALQMVTEDAVLAMLNYLYEETESENVCIAGGVALNSVLNGKILGKTPFKRVFIQPSAGDSGTAIGAAKYVQHVLDPEAEREHIQHSSFGPEYSNDEIRKYLDDTRVKYTQFDSEEELLRETARLIHDKSVIGWFHGKMEWGPRALGNRSILASPLHEDMRDVLNAKVKHREMFRPFAPVICVDDAPDYFECDEPVPEPTDYMLMVYPIKEDKRELIPAVTHVDGSGRLQTIRESQNPLYYRLIKQFGEISSVPLLVNTSFNIRGEPIVCTPHDAYRCMMGTEIDYLVIDNFLVKRSDNPRDMWNAEVRE
jgi:carbamoyltransferase